VRRRGGAVGAVGAACGAVGALCWRGAVAAVGWRGAARGAPPRRRPSHARANAPRPSCSAVASRFVPLNAVLVPPIGAGSRVRLLARAPSAGRPTRRSGGSRGRRRRRDHGRGAVWWRGARGPASAEAFPRSRERPPPKLLRSGLPVRPAPRGARTTHRGEVPRSPARAGPFRRAPHAPLGRIEGATTALGSWPRRSWLTIRREAGARSHALARPRLRSLQGVAIGGPGGRDLERLRRLRSRGPVVATGGPGCRDRWVAIAGLGC
jgi:hypothetical protein